MANLSIPSSVCFFFITILHYISISAKSDTYIVFMDLSAMPKVFSDHHTWYASTLSAINRDSQVTTTTTTPPTTPTTSAKPVSLIYTYTNVLHGFSASLSSSELESLEKSHGFVSSIRDVPVKVDTTHSSQFLQLNSIFGAWPASHYGKDVIIGVVDSGVYPESESFSDAGMTEVPSRWKGGCASGTQFNSSMCNKKLIGAKFFNKGLVSNNPYADISMNSPRDTAGHGTHTSSTAAGSYVKHASFFGYGRGTSKGMAPLARVAMYKAVWGVEGEAYVSDIIAAIDQAIEDGVDVLSLSLGQNGMTLYEDPISIASFAAMEKGIFVATSAGNRGPRHGTVNNAVPWVLTVSAGTMDREFGGIVTLSNGVSVPGLSLYPLNNAYLSKVPLFRNPCTNAEDLRNFGFKLVVCIDTDDSVGEQVENVKNANIAGGIFISNSSQIQYFLQSSFPAIFIDPTTGRFILDYIKMNADPSASVKFQRTRVGISKTNPAPRVAEYSSRGPSPSCPSILKPDIMAPGTLVLAAWPKTIPVPFTGDLPPLYSDYMLLTGTSMSCPHAAGIAALLKGIHPEWSPAAIRSAMMTTSDVLDNTHNPIKEFGVDYRPASPLSMGSGHVNPNKAMDPGLIYDADAEDYVRLLCSMKFTSKQIHIITRRSRGYNCLKASSDLNYPSFIATFRVNDSSSNVKVVQEFKRTVTNVGEGRSTYIAKLTAMDGFQVFVKPEKLVFKLKNEKQSYRVSLHGPKLMKKDVVHGYLSWVEVGGKHVVRSPIVATRLNTALGTDH